MKLQRIGAAVAVMMAVGACAGGGGDGQTTAAKGSLEAQASKTSSKASSTTSSSTTTTTVPERVFTRENYAELATSPDDFKGSSIDVVGRVFGEVSRDENGVYFQMFAIPGESEGNTIVAFLGDLQFATDDFVHVVGEVIGDQEG